MIVLRTLAPTAALALAVLLPLSRAQQFVGTNMFTNYTGLSTECQQALATNVTCSSYLGMISERTTIVSECTLDTDIIVVENVAYPAIFFVDNYLFTYELSCRTDSTTGQYCDPLVASWSNQSLTTSQLCSDCWLGGLALELASPFGYDDVMAQNYASLTSSCNATTYSYATPTQYALNVTATTKPAAVTTTMASSCTGSYEVSVGDTCNSVAQALNVSTYSLLYMNNLDLYCLNWDSTVVNTTLCIPPQCETRVWQSTDTCDSVVSGLSNVTIPQFLTWNPNFNALCQNAVNYIDYMVCIGPPGGYLNHTTDMTGTATVQNPTNIITAVPAPTNALNGSTTDCGLWYTVGEGDTCSLVTVANSISLVDFYFLNPEIDANCTNLELGEAYCIAAVGDISTYSGYPVTTPLFTVTTASFPAVDTSIPTTTSDPGFIYTPTYLPTAPDTRTDCVRYVNYDNSTYNLNSCKWIAWLNEVTTANFLSWNPSLNSDLSACAMQPGYSYCAILNSSYTTGDDYTTGSDSEAISSSQCLSLNATEPSTVSNCNCFTGIYSYQSGDYECANIADDFDITEAELIAWNPWLATDCDANLYANLASGDMRAVCIGVNSTVSATTTNPSTASATATTSAVPTQTGYIDGCQEFYTVESGDDCSTMEAEFGVTLAQLYAWNPSIGSTCTGLWLGYAYCVKGPAATASTTASAPTQTGIVSNCNEYHTVVSKDSCAAVESEYGVTFAQLYEWNPAIGSDCEYLNVGYAICVGVS
ncbi:hypothetical protein CBS147332_4124 [Penicillium roqueforti]|nr:hypothetical protein CBS147332_4124 [Penicillium roqueforti]KAI3108985.1 hypothetical protein CBS147331_5777 [Penicillium roqueforti]